eukprot:2738126-Heterocapsa_arctica.AAC.1
MPAGRRGRDGPDGVPAPSWLPNPRKRAAADVQGLGSPCLDAGEGGRETGSELRRPPSSAVQ